MKKDLRYASHPEDFRSYDTARIRKEFLIESVFIPDEITIVYSMYDRFIAGGIMPVSKSLELQSPEELRSEYFLERREIGIINTGGDAIIETEEATYDLSFKDALYLGKGTAKVIFRSADQANPAKLYFNSAPAHKSFLSTKITLNEAEVVEMGSQESSNSRIVNKLIVNSVLTTCQLQMGMTELKSGSVWNTMPVHTHNRRMEAYFYFGLPGNQAVCHFMGSPDETRHIWIRNEQAVLSPSWSIHSGVGTSNYTFIWGMSGENLDYSDMEVRQPDGLK